MAKKSVGYYSHQAAVEMQQAHTMKTFAQAAASRKDMNGAREYAKEARKSAQTSRANATSAQIEASRPRGIKVKNRIRTKK